MKTIKLRQIGEVVTVNGYDGVIESIKFENGEPFYEVRFLKSGIIPPVMDIHPDMIQNKGGQDPNKCPVCQTDWKVTEFNNKKWRDCLKCGLTEKQAIEAAAKLDKKEEEPPELNEIKFDWGSF